MPCPQLLSKDQLISIALGQFVSIIQTGTGICSTFLSKKYQVSVPTTQSFMVYLFMGIIGCSILVKQKKFFSTLKEKWIRYLLLAVCDVEANFFIVTAYNYTTIISVMLLDCLSIPCTMILTYFILKTKYNVRHFIGAFISVFGLVVLIFSDFESSDNQNGKYLFGDALALLAATLYSISNVGQEYTIKMFSMFEFIGMIGFFGTIISLIQMVILEGKTLVNLTWTFDIVFFIALFVLLLLGIYFTVPWIMKYGGSAIFNLSLLTSDAFALIAGIYIFDVVPSMWYFFSLGITICGLIIYNVKNEYQTDVVINTPAEKEPLETNANPDEIIDLEEEVV